MKLSKIFLLLAFSLMLTSCEKPVFKQFDKFDENRWMKTDVRHYEFDLEQSGDYDLIADFSSAYGSPFAAIPLKMTIQYPDNKIVTEDISLKLLDEQGTVLSGCSGDYCDLEQVLFSGKKLDAGHYKISIANEFDHEYLPNVLGVGIRVRNAGND